MNSEERFMLRCIELAQKGTGKVAPNPMVGATLVYEGKIIGEGWHEQYGQPHAEVNCLKSVSPENRKLISKSKLYVSLEPCNHFGKTPPCCDLIIDEQIPEVVIGCPDSDKKVSGRGIQRLTAAGIQVTVGILEKECRELNRRFFTRQEKERPFIILKWAETTDGYMASEVGGESIQISGWPETRMVHKMRFEEDAFLVGYNTVLNDNPRLNNRFWKPGKQPLRIIVDFKNSLSDNFHIRDNQQETLIFNDEADNTKGNTSWRKLQPDIPFVTQIINRLEGINSLVVEGGAKTLVAFLNSGCWDEIHLWKSNNKTLGDGIAAPKINNAKLVDTLNLGTDQRLVFVPDNK